MALVHAGSGQPSARYEYAPFGEPLRVTGDAALLNPFRFSTKYTDDETGLLYYGYRYYSPTLAKWLNRDPLEEEGGLNLYAFVQNNPINFVDALGEMLLDVTATGAYQDDAKLAQAKTGSSFISKIKDAVEAYSDAQDFIATISDVADDDVFFGALSKNNETFSSQLAGKGKEVYVLRDSSTDKVVYGGIAKDPNERFKQHTGKRGKFAGRAASLVVEIITGGRVPTHDARNMEQALIHSYGLKKNGGKLDNSINSISPDRSDYASRLKSGFKALKDNGFDF